MNLYQHLREAQWAANRARSLHLDNKVQHMIWKKEMGLDPWTVNKGDFTPTSFQHTLKRLNEKDREVMMIQHVIDTQAAALMEGAL